MTDDAPAPHEIDPVDLVLPPADGAPAPVVADGVPGTDLAVIDDEDVGPAPDLEAEPEAEPDPHARGFWWPGSSPVGVLLVHDLGLTPAGLRHIGTRLYEEGCWVAAPLLPGHDPATRTFETPTPPQILAELDVWLAALATNVPTRVVVGCGLGASAALAPLAAGRAAPNVSGLATIGAPFATMRRTTLRTSLQSWVLGTTPGPEPDVKHPDAEEPAVLRLPREAQDVFAEIERLGREAAPSVRAPTLVFHSRDDHVVPAADARALHAALGSATKELVWLERSFHQAWVDHDATHVAERVGRFSAALSELAHH